MGFRALGYPMYHFRCHGVNAQISRELAALSSPLTPSPQEYILSESAHRPGQLATGLVPRLITSIGTVMLVHSELSGIESVVLTT